MVTFPQLIETTVDEFPLFSTFVKHDLKSQLKNSTILVFFEGLAYHESLLCHSGLVSSADFGHFMLFPILTPSKAIVAVKIVFFRILMILKMVTFSKYITQIFSVNTLVMNDNFYFETRQGHANQLIRVQNMKFLKCLFSSSQI